MKRHGMYAAFVRKAGGPFYLRLFEHELDAADYCDRNDWKYEDETGEILALDYMEVA